MPCGAKNVEFRLAFGYSDRNTAVERTPDAAYGQNKFGGSPIVVVVLEVQERDWLARLSELSELCVIRNILVAFFRGPRRQ
jgi:hypothetical protein